MMTTREAITDGERDQKAQNELEEHWHAFDRGAPLRLSDEPPSRGGGGSGGHPRENRDEWDIE